MKKPSVLILDEPSALLNPAQRRMLFSKLRDFADHGMNVIVITHYLDEAKQFGDEIFFIEDGRVCFTVKNKDDNFSEIEKKFNHTFINLHSIVCWDINTNVLKHNEEVKPYK